MIKKDLTLQFPKITSRIAIFAHYDKKGIIDEYVILYLKELKKYINDIIFVSDGVLSLNEKNKIKNLCIDIIDVKHEEYDFGSYKRGFLLFKNKYNEKFQNADELIFVNDSCYQINSFGKIFEDMANYQECDMWSLTDNYMGNALLVPYYLQSYFLVFRKSIFLEDFFSNFISNIKKLENKDEIIENYEYGISKLIQDNYKKTYSYFNLRKFFDYITENNQIIYNDIFEIISAKSSLNKRKISNLIYKSGIYNLSEDVVHHDKYFIMIKMGFPLIKRAIFDKNNASHKDKKMLFLWREIIEKYTKFSINIIDNHLERIDIQPKTSKIFKNKFNFLLHKIF